MRKLKMLLLMNFFSLLFACQPSALSTIAASAESVTKRCTAVFTGSLKSLKIEEQKVESSSDDETSLLPAYTWNAKMRIR